MYGENQAVSATPKPDPSLPRVIKRIHEELKEMADKLNFTQDRLHSILNQRSPDKISDPTAKDMPNDIQGNLETILRFIGIQSQRISEINNHIEAIV